MEGRELPPPRSIQPGGEWLLDLVLKYWLRMRLEKQQFDSPRA